MEATADCPLGNPYLMTCRYLWFCIRRGLHTVVLLVSCPSAFGVQLNYFAAVQFEAFSP